MTVVGSVVGYIQRQYFNWTEITVAMKKFKK